jgi:hypothetical protein
MQPIDVSSFEHLSFLRHSEFVSRHSVDFLLVNLRGSD